MAEEIFDFGFTFKKWNELEYQLINNGGLKNYIIKEKNKNEKI